MIEHLCQACNHASSPEVDAFTAIIETCERHRLSPAILPMMSLYKMKVTTAKLDIISTFHKYNSSLLIQCQHQIKFIIFEHHQFINTAPLTIR